MWEKTHLGKFGQKPAWLPSKNDFIAASNTLFSENLEYVDLKCFRSVLIDLVPFS